MITIEQVSMENANGIFDFEIENRSYFEATLPSRGDDYYHIENFMVIVNEICEEQRNDSLYMNIIKNELNEIVGRINLFPIKHEKYSRAFELGYRIAEKHQGKGYATESVNKLINIAFNEYAIECIQALTSPKNVASQIVLTKNGFSFVTRLKNDVEVNGIFEDSVVFEKIQQIEQTQLNE